LSWACTEVTAPNKPIIAKPAMARFFIYSLHATL
jgi:hypothetical protein